MTGVAVSVDCVEVTLALSRLAKRLGDLRPAMAEIGAAMVNAKDLGFRAESDPWGKAWAPLSAVTFARRRKGSKRILRDTGHLQDSIAYTADGDSATMGVGVGVSTNVKYAGTHQFGARMGEYGRYSQVSRRSKFKEGDFRRNAGTVKGFPIPWGDIPARPFLPLSPAGSVDLPQPLLDGILDILRAHVEQSA